MAALALARAQHSSCACASRAGGRTDLAERSRKSHTWGTTLWVRDASACTRAPALHPHALALAAAFLAPTRCGTRRRSRARRPTTRRAGTRRLEARGRACEEFQVCGLEPHRRRLLCASRANNPSIPNLCTFRPWVAGTKGTGRLFQSCTSTRTRCTFVVLVPAW